MSKRSAIIERVTTTPLSGIAVEKRRRLAATLGLFAMLFVAVGAVAATGASTGMIKAFVVIALLVAVFLALMAWGVLRSVRLDVAAQRLDAAIDDTLRAHGAQVCGCGHEHDADELSVVDADPEHDQNVRHAVATEEPCAHDGSGLACSHSCTTCVLAAATQRRPSPRPRPRPAPFPR